jgi:hypothetical protein
MPAFHRSLAQRKRAEAEEDRRVAQVVSLTAHRDQLLKRAEALHLEADRLEQQAAAIEKARTNLRAGKGVRGKISP